MNQVITEPTHNLEDSSSCIDLIFSNQLNFIMDSGVQPTLYSKCHHPIIYPKLWKLNIFHLTLVKFGITADLRQIWDRSIKSFDWSKLLSGKNVHEQVELFHKRLLNIFHNFIPNKTIVCDDRDPPWNGYFRVKESLVSLIL